MNLNNPKHIARLEDESDDDWRDRIYGKIYNSMYKLSKKHKKPILKGDEDGE